MKESTANTIVTVISVLEYVEAFFIFLCGIFLLILSGLTPQLMSAESMSQYSATITPQLMGTIFIILGVVFIAFSVFKFFLARGLWKHQEWSRIAMIVLSILGILNILFSIISTIVTGPILMVLIRVVFSLPFLALNCLMLYWFGLNKDIVALFKRKPVASRRKK